MYLTASRATSGSKTGDTSIAGIITVAIQLHVVSETMSVQKVGVFPLKLQDDYIRTRFALLVVHDANLETITNIEGASLSRLSWKSVALSIPMRNRACRDDQTTRNEA